MSNTPPVTPPSWNYNDLLSLLSQERLGSYLNAARNDVDDAFALYEWNMAAASEVMRTTGMVEVIVRNALDRELVAWASSRGTRSWLDIAPLDAKAKAEIKKARDRATNFGKKAEIHGKVIAELSFGFWRFIVTRRYLTSLWIPALHKAFPHATVADIAGRQTAVDKALRNLAFLRNRAAHHEPIHRRNLLGDERASVVIAEWIDPTAGAWVSGRAGLAAVASHKPSPPQ